ncbi:MAG: exosortase A [Nitrosomonadales bacterium]|nr:exosortase A [Nitrosomonadales bacterium]
MKTSDASHTLRSPDHRWREYLALTVAAVLSLVWIYQGTALSLVTLWQSSETYAHGFIIYPISLYLIWRQRVYLSSLTPRPSALATAALAVLGVGWMVAQSAGVQVVAQYMFVAMIPALTAAILGLRIARVLVFPLAFTLLAVPFGEIFIRPLIDFTADFTVFALQLTGIPVFREGSQFTIPSGSWSVVEACSGLRYLIASFTLGCLYAYLTYRSRLRQLVFIVLSIIVPIIANGMRAYLIVLIGHFSNMQLAVGVDHLIYGWIFFGLVMLALFWVGSRWRDDEAVAAENMTAAIPAAATAASPVKAARFAFAALLLAWGSPAYLHHLEQLTFNPAPVTVMLPQTIGPWTASTPIAGLQPHFPGATTTALQEYRNGNQTIGIYIAFFRNQHNGAEAVSSQNRLANEKSTEWSLTGESLRHLPGKKEPGGVRQSRLRRGNLHMLAWQWYWIGDTQTANPYMAKWLQARQRLMGRGDDSADVVIFASYDAQPDEVEATMEEFLARSSSAIRNSLQQARGI